MNLKDRNINRRITELNTEIQNLEQRLAAKVWERKKYIQFSDNQESKYSNK